uniref:Uncharacterized protein n=1 Tax=Arundo donax TaxID=35708 RepID=A0A0A9HPK0_ARUDO
MTREGGGGGAEDDSTRPLNPRSMETLPSGLKRP